MHTAQHIVSKCLTGDLARDRTIILVTHHITLCLPVASYLVELDKGKILHQGTIPELEERGLLLKVIETEEETFPQTKSPIQTSFNEMDASQDLSSSRLIHRQPTDGKLVEKEARAEGRVAFRSYITYLRASGISSWVATITVALLIRAINIINQVRVLFCLLCVFSHVKYRSICQIGAKHTIKSIRPFLLSPSSRNLVFGVRGKIYRRQTRMSNLG